jgi:tetratricopeptide (TPR) repeat protein
VNTAILVRDMRNDWTDNLYMLMGQAYYYKNDLDSAYVLFQFVNYAYAPKEKDGYPIPIGSNANADDGGNAFTISTDERRNIVKRTFSLPPSRNESFVWQVRTFLMKDDLTRASVLIDMLREDPNFPERLESSLHELQALLYYKQAVYDSAAFHLNQALGNAATQSERARWEYLIAQLYERSDQHASARTYFEKAASHTLDPIMEVYARLNAIRQNKGNEAGGDYIRKNLEALHKMTRKELFPPYLGIIYYAAGEMELERNDRAAAKKYFLKSAAGSGMEASMRDQAFLKLGWLYLDEKKYPDAKNAYDSVNIVNPMITDSLKILSDHKLALDRVVPQIQIIERQDSLQRIAAMPADERNAYIKKMVRAYRKKQGLSEEEAGNNSNPFTTNAANADMFNDNSSGEWYFNNPSLKSKGFNDFRSKWGNRPNTDNWQLLSMISKQKPGTSSGKLNNLNGAETSAGTAPPAEITPESLLKNVPLTPETLKKSQDSVENALFALGKALQDLIPDYRSAIHIYDSLESRYPSTRYYQEALFNSYYCYLKLDDPDNAARILALMKQKFPSGRYLSLIENPPSGPPDAEIRNRATRDYEKIYQELIEGHFEQALAEKKIQDSVYGQKYWTPQLLYVEALYYMHTRHDSVAKATLNQIITTFSGTDMAAKAKNTLRVLNERERLEEYLTNLKVTRATEDSVGAANNGKDQPKNANPDSASAKSAVKLKADSGLVSKKRPDSLQAKIPAAFASAFSSAPEKPHAVALIMDKVDPVYVTESKNAFDRYNRENYYGKHFEINQVALSDSIKIVLINGFENAAAALAYLDKAGKVAGREILPWLPANKYSFIIIDDQNLAILQSNKDIPAYRKFLSAYFPDKFPPAK